MKSWADLLWERTTASWPESSLQDVTSLVAVSGGPDSVALARLLSLFRPKSARFILVHYNHRLRGTESDRDEEFARELARQLALEFIGSSEFEPDRALETATGKSRRGEGLEAIARQDRYRFLRKVARATGARFVATGHTLDDQVETLIQRVFRGSGFRGLCGIPRIRKLDTGVTLIRPLLDSTRRQLLEFLAEQNQEYRVDQSNQSGDFTRNRIRNELIPLAVDLFVNDIRSSVIGIADHARALFEWIGPQIDALLEQHVVFESGSVRIDVDALSEVPRVLIQELLHGIWQRMEWPEQQMNRKKWTHLADMIETARFAPRQNLPGNLFVESDGSSVVIWDGSVET